MNEEKKKNNGRREKKTRMIFINIKSCGRLFFFLNIFVFFLIGEWNGMEIRESERCRQKKESNKYEVK